MDYSETFTIEACQKPSTRERIMAPGSGVLAKELAKRNEHVRAVAEEYKDLVEKFGNPRRDLLLAARNQEAQVAEPARRNCVPPRMANAAAEMNRQRSDIKGRKTEAETRTRSAKTKARKLNIPSVLISDDEETLAGLEMMESAEREHRRDRRNESVLPTEESL